MSTHATNGLIVGILLTATSVLPSAGCVALDSIPLVSATKTLTEEFKTGETPEIEVSTFNGTIDVSPAESHEVVIEVTKRASGIDDDAAHAVLDLVEVSMIQKGNRISVIAKPMSGHSNLGASVVLSVPPGAKVNLHSSNGGIVCEGIRGGVEAVSSNGKLEIVEGTGKLQLSTSNGAIDVDATDAALDARTSNGAIRFTGSLAKTDHKLKSSNGRIRLTLPADSAFRFEGSTSNGRIECAFPLESDSKPRRTRLKGSVGENPQTTVIASTSNSSIEVLKAGDKH